MPSPLLICMTPVSWTVLASRIRLATAGLTTRISSAAMRPPPFLRSRVWATTPRSTSESTLRICACWPAGNWSTMRSTALMALLVWRVANTRWPVFAVSSARAIVSRSRISPTRTMFGILAQRGLQGAGEAPRVAAHLALVDEAALARVHELDRVLQGDDVRLLVAVDVVDHRGQGGRLAAAGGAGDEDEPLGDLAEALDDRRQRELLEGQDLRRDLAHDRGDAVAVAEDVHAEPRRAGQRVGEVGVVLLRELLAVPLLHHRLQQLEDLLGAQDRHVVHRLHVAVDRASGACGRRTGGGRTRPPRPRAPAASAGGPAPARPWRPGPPPSSSRPPIPSGRRGGPGRR